VITRGLIWPVYGQRTRRSLAHLWQRWASPWTSRRLVQTKPRSNETRLLCSWAAEGPPAAHRWLRVLPNRTVEICYGYTQCRKDVGDLRVPGVNTRARALCRSDHDVHCGNRTFVLEIAELCGLPSPSLTHAPFRTLGAADCGNVACYPLQLQRPLIAALSKARGRTQPGSAHKRSNPQQHAAA
jgi:hypothetical protein